MIPLYVGYDRREACAFHVFNQSVIEHATQPVNIVPLSEKALRFDGKQDGTNTFVYSRYLVPHLQDHKGWAIFCDGDMVVKDDIAKLWSLRDESKAVQVVKHNYKTSHSRKYIGSPMEDRNIDYPRKNWSSVILWNCAHPSNRILTREYVAEAGGAVLHRFKWLDDDEVGQIPLEWNWLVGEYDNNNFAKLLHYTHGVPGFNYYMRCDHHRDWNAYLMDTINLIGERPEETVRRATWRS